MSFDGYAYLQMDGIQIMENPVARRWVLATLYLF
jgi:hypothetical protein